MILRNVEKFTTTTDEDGNLTISAAMSKKSVATVSSSSDSSVSNATNAETPRRVGPKEPIFREKPIFTKQTHHFYPSIQAIVNDFTLSYKTAQKLLSDRQCPFGQAFTEVENGYWIANRARAVIGKGPEYPLRPRG